MYTLIMKKVKQLMLVEDDQITAFLTQNIIKKTGIAEQIVVCENGQEALEHLYKGLHTNSHQEIHFPELIFLDLNMPVMDGYEFLKKFTEIEELKGKNIHVIIVSSASLLKESKRIENLPTSGYIEKPIDENKIATILASLNI